MLLLRLSSCMEGAYECVFLCISDLSPNLPSVAEELLDIRFMAELLDQS